MSHGRTENNRPSVAANIQGISPQLLTKYGDFYTEFFVVKPMYLGVYQPNKHVLIM
jgi:hypothetical protein